MILFGLFGVVWCGMVWFRFVQCSFRLVLRALELRLRFCFAIVYTMLH